MHHIMQIRYPRFGFLMAAKDFSCIIERTTHGYPDWTYLADDVDELLYESDLAIFIPAL
jgi:hypothetical protein